MNTTAFCGACGSDLSTRKPFAFLLDGGLTCFACRITADAPAPVLAELRGEGWQDGYDAGRRVSNAELEQVRRERDRLADALHAVEMFVDQPRRLDSTAMNQLKSLVAGWDNDPALRAIRERRTTR
jgi:hypothetical protein